jgi:hypothetical protein
MNAWGTSRLALFFEIYIFRVGAMDAFAGIVIIFDNNILIISDGLCAVFVSIVSRYAAPAPGTENYVQEVRWQPVLLHGIVSYFCCNLICWIFWMNK